MIVSEEKKSPEFRKAVLGSRLDEVRERLTQKKSIAKFFIIFLLIYSFCFLLMINFTGGDILFMFEDYTMLGFVLGFSALLSIFSSIAYSYIINSLYKYQERIILGELAVISSEELQDQIEEDFFTNLVKINFKYIDKYYLQTQIQADKSYSLAVISSIVGFIIIISGIVLMFFGKIKASYLATGTGIISEFISAVIFYLYNKTISKMGEYHHKLVLTQNISLALKITEQMPEADKI